MFFKSKLQSKKIVGVFIVAILIVGSGIVFKNKSIISTFNPLQSSYEKCINECVESKGEAYGYCKPMVRDFVKNYDLYYSPYGVSNTFAKKFGNTDGTQSKDVAYKIACFRVVSVCRVMTCKDYLGK